MTSIRPDPGSAQSETKYVIFAVRPLDPANLLDADRELLVPGSLVDLPTTRSVDLTRFG